MKIKIYCTGELEILRGSKMKIQECKYNQDGRRCTDRCPHFGDPVEVLNHPTSRQGKKIYMLDLCDGKTLEGEITDERK